LRFRAAAAFWAFFLKPLFAVFSIASLHELTVKCKLLASQEIAAQQAARAQAEAAAQTRALQP